LCPRLSTSAATMLGRPRPRSWRRSFRPIADRLRPMVRTVSTGTAANAVSLSVLTPHYGTVFCHRSAHVQTSEAGAPELFTGGAKLTLLGREHRLDAGELAHAIAEAGAGQRHRVQPAAISVTQEASMAPFTNLMNSRRFVRQRAQPRCGCIRTARGSPTRL
jgi:threonine aldolase